jgi:hypothetical protein
VFVFTFLFYLCFSCKLVIEKSNFFPGLKGIKTPFVSEKWFLLYLSFYKWYCWINHFGLIAGWIVLDNTKGLTWIYVLVLFLVLTEWNESSCGKKKEMSLLGSCPFYFMLLKIPLLSLSNGEIDDDNLSFFLVFPQNV